MAKFRGLQNRVDVVGDPYFFARRIRVCSVYFQFSREDQETTELLLPMNKNFSIDLQQISNVWKLLLYVSLASTWYIMGEERLLGDRFAIIGQRHCAETPSAPVNETKPDDCRCDLAAESFVKGMCIVLYGACLHYLFTSLYHASRTCLLY